jgi:hypothetical protein
LFLSERSRVQRFIILYLLFVFDNYRKIKIKKGMGDGCAGE